MEIKFDSIGEFEDFINLIKFNTNDKKVETVEMSNNKRFLNRHDINDLYLRQININDIVKETLKELREDITDLSKKTVTKPTPALKNKQTSKNNDKKLCRVYNKEYKMFNFTGLNEDGTFIQKKGKQVKFDINDVLKLKKAIPDTIKYPTWNALTEIVKLDAGKTMPRVCNLIENGYFDEYIKEWEQIQANKFYNNTKPVPVINNPQKRRENGRI